jgi:ABC-type sugar transport system ATPase subunit
MERLRTEGLTKQFPGVTALNDVNFELQEGEIHALVGENGAGKSTFVKILAGIFQPSAGKIFIENSEIKFASPKDAFAYIGVVHQERELVPFYSGICNLFLGQEITSSGFLNRRAMQQKALDFMRQYNLDLDMDTPVTNLGSGMQEMITILKVLFRSPKIVIFDEPTAPLSIKETDVLFRLIKDLKSKGTSIIYITHRLPEVFQLADRVSVLRNGEKVVTANVTDIAEQELIRFMIAKDINQQYPKAILPRGDEIMKVKFHDSDIKIQIHAQEIVGFAGLVGSGRSELAKKIVQGHKSESLNITLDNKAFKPSGPKFAIDHGIVMIPEDRRGEGLVPSFNVRENLSFSHLSFLSRFGFRDEKKISERCDSIIKDLGIKVYSQFQLVNTLSGGNQQKVSLGKWLDANAKIWIFDEPTQGIDVETKVEIYRIMERLAAQGAGIWFISSDLKELISISDKIYVMYQSKIVGEFMRPFEAEEILQTMLGIKNKEISEVTV